MKDVQPITRNRYSEHIENNATNEEEIDETLLERLRAQLERANQTIVNMRNKEKLLRTR